MFWISLILVYSIKVVFIQIRKIFTDFVTVSSQKKGPSRFFWEVELPVENRRAIWRTFREHEN